MKRPVFWVLVVITISACMLMGGMLIGRQLDPIIITQYVFPTETGQTDQSNTDGTEAASVELLIDINTATAEELEQLPGIGKTIAERITQYRAQNGSFQSIEDLKNVNGIGDKRLEQIQPYITVGGNG